jgi:molybdopterin synthase sulfur carrier subunit
MLETSGMAEVHFTANLQRHVASPQVSADGSTVREVLDAVFRQNEILRGYVLDEQSALRKHMGIIVDGVVLQDRVRLSDPVRPGSRIFVMQALSGG